jgi:hypothetical protein
VRPSVARLAAGAHSGGDPYTAVDPPGVHCGCVLDCQEEVELCPDAVRGFPHHDGRGFQSLSQGVVRIATITANRADVFPVGTSVGVYPPGAVSAGHDSAPGAAAIVSASVDAAGQFSATNAGIESGKTYVLAASVGGAWRYLRARSTLDKHDGGTATGTGNTSANSDQVTSLSTTTGTFVPGQFISGPGIPAQCRIKSISGSTITMDCKATATATGVALQAYGAGAWQAKVRRRKVALGTS